MKRLFLALTAALALSACMGSNGEYIAGSTAAGALLGAAITGDKEGALRGAAAGAAYGIATAKRGRSQRGDACARYRNNQGAYASCKRGQERRARERQRELERRAYKRGRGN